MILQEEDIKLSRSLKILDAVSISVSDISPTAGVFLQIPVVIAMVGTGSLVVTLVAGIIALCVAMTMAELGSMYPISGGIYSVIQKVLGRPIGFIALIAYLGEGIFIPSVVALGAATYFCNVFPIFNPNVVALILMLLAIGVAIINISSGAKFAAFLLTLELLVIGIFTIGSILHIHQPLQTLFSLQKLNVGGDSLTHVSIGGIFTAVTIMLFSFNGFDSAINFSEETEGDSSNVGKSVSRAAIIGFLAQLIPLGAMLLAAPNVVALMKSHSPINYITLHILGPVGVIILNLGAATAMFACTIAVILQFSRVLYTSGRDNVWPNKISMSLAILHSKFHTPWVATLALGILGALLCFFSNLGNLITFTSVLIVTLYALIAVCSFIIRFKGKGKQFPYKNPLRIFAPTIALIGGIAALTQQAPKDLITVGCIIFLSILYYIFYLKKKNSNIESILEEKADF